MDISWKLKIPLSIIMMCGDYSMQISVKCRENGMEQHREALFTKIK